MKKRCMSVLLAAAMIVSLCLTPADVCATEIAPPEEDVVEAEESAIEEEPAAVEELVTATEDETERGQWNEAGDMLTLSEEELSEEELAAAQQLSLQTEASVTESSAYSAMMALKSTYYEGMPWTDANPSDGYRFYGYRENEHKIVVGYGCAAFAFILSDAAFGDLPASDNYTFDWNKLCVGDILRINSDLHSVIILEKYEDYIIVAEGNYNSSIHWGRKITKTQLQDTFTYQTTRYPDGYTPTTPITPAQEEMIGQFVSRLYNTCLNRDPDAGGFRFWVNAAKAGEVDGTAMAKNFILCDEMQAKNLSNEDFVEILYIAFMGRTSDSSGKAFWVNKLENGASRYGVFMGFANSQEFKNICDNYGIRRETAEPMEGRDKNFELTAFMSRLYTKALGRTYDVGGINYWCDRVYNRELTIAEVSTTYFFHSEEFLAKKLDDKEYIKVLYRTFMDREYDQPGLEFWLNQLATGTSRDTVLMEFEHSKEFSEIKKKYGL